MATLKDQTYNFQEESTEETTKTQQLPILLVEEPEETWVTMVIFKSEEATHRQTSKVEISDHHTREVTTTM